MENKYSFIILGATGFAGKYVVQTLARNAQNLQWAVAGRSELKLKDTLKHVSRKIGIDINNISIITCDTSDDESLLAMAKQTKVVLNCVGPYRFYGEPVVKACVSAGTHYVDISGEPSFIENMVKLYDEEAAKNSCYIISACGFDSIPCDLGTDFAIRHFQGTLNEIECYHEIIATKGMACNFGTFLSMIHGVANANELCRLRKSLSEGKSTIFKSIHKLPFRGMLFYSDDVNGWCVPFLGSDKSIVQRSQMYNFENNDQRPVQIQTYVKTSSLLSAISLIVWAIFFFFMTKFSFGISLLQNYPEIFTFGFFTKNGPTDKQIEGASFKTTLVGKGWLNKKLAKNEDPTDLPKDKMKCVVEGAEPGYIATSTFIVASALTLIQDAENLPPKKGGVYTTAAAFGKTPIIYRLNKMGVKFIVEN